MNSATRANDDTELTTRDLLVLLLALGVVMVLPIGRGAELPVSVGAIAGFVAAFSPLRQLAPAAAMRALAVLFLAYWVPTLLSAPDAAEPGRTWGTVAAILRFAPFAFLIIAAARGRALWNTRATTLIGIVVLAWSFDALVQAATAWSLGGYLGSDRVSGVFGDDNLKLGPVLAVLSPFALDWLLRRFGRVVFTLGWVLIAAAILLAGSRASWITFALVSLVMAWRASRGGRQFALALAAVVAMTAVVGTIAYLTSPLFAVRVDRTLALAGGNASEVDYALAGRVPIFCTAARMALAHPVNGVGVRGFRYAYADYAAPGDPWVGPDDHEGAAHPHQIVLEIAAETGIPGVIAWFGAGLIAWRLWRRQTPESRVLGFPAALALAAMTFPLNTHFAIYSTFWSLLFWWLIAMWLATWRDPEPAR